MTILGGHPVPDWADAIEEDENGARIVARAPRGRPSSAPYDLTIKEDDRGILVTETVIGDRLPPECPELHILPGGIFCTSRQRDSLDSPAAAESFWSDLGDFLTYQDYAERRRHWPPGRWLSHGGAAADYQEAAELIALTNGWADDYANAIENSDGWIAAAVRRGIGPPAVSVCACAAKLPADCRHRHRCHRRRSVERLVLTERRRRDAERRYLDQLYDRGLRCCGRIDGCRLEAGRL